MATRIFEDIRNNGEQVLQEIREIIREGNARKVMVVNKNGKTLFEAPLTIGSVGAGGLFLLHPIISAVGAFIMLSNDVKVVVERYPDADKNGRDEHEIEADFIPIHED
ncbi:MAG: DUF4342 domain-containing protein [Balneolia bacterium]|nr:DUF4342 domain-containing protein [Balneolia bacterium]